MKDAAWWLWACSSWKFRVFSFGFEACESPEWNNISFVIDTTNDWTDDELYFRGSIYVFQRGYWHRNHFSHRTHTTTRSVKKDFFFVSFSFFSFLFCFLNLFFAIVVGDGWIGLKRNQVLMIWSDCRISRALNWLGREDMLCVVWCVNSVNFLLFLFLFLPAAAVHCSNSFVGNAILGDWFQEYWFKIIFFWFDYSGLLAPVRFASPLFVLLLHDFPQHISWCSLCEGIYRSPNCCWCTVKASWVIEIICRSWSFFSCRFSSDLVILFLAWEPRWFIAGYALRDLHELACNWLISSSRFQIATES